MGVEYVALDRVFEASDIITLHCPLVPATHHLIDADALAEMRDGVMIINTSRGALIDTPAVIDALKIGKVGYLGLDVYEEEAFFTANALESIAATTIANFTAFEAGKRPPGLLEA